MTWTKEDTEALASHGRGQAMAGAAITGRLLGRAAAHIESLEARVEELADSQPALLEFAANENNDLRKRIATLEAERARGDRCGECGRSTIPRAALVSALRERAKRVLANSKEHRPHSLQRREMIGAWAELSARADEIERGEWPKEPTP